MEYSGPDPNIPLPKRFQIAQIIAFAFVASIGTYAFLIFIMRTAGEPQPPRPFDPMFRTLLWITGLAAMAVGPTLMDKLLPRPTTIDDVTVAGYLQTKMIVKLAVIETGAIFGLLIFFLTHTWNDFAMLGGISAALMLLELPTRSAWENEARAFGLNWTLRS